MNKTDKIKEAITDYFGKRCKEYEKDCGCCEAWKQFDKLEEKFDMIKMYGKWIKFCKNDKDNPTFAEFCYNQGKENVWGMIDDEI